MPKDTSQDKDAFEAFQAAFLDGQRRVDAAWQEACLAHPIAGEAEPSIHVTAALLEKQATAQSQRNAWLRSALERSCAELWQSDYLAHNAKARNLRQAVDGLRKQWRRGRDSFFREQFHEFFIEFGYMPSSDGGRRQQQDEVYLLENEFWFLGGFAEAVAVACGISNYALPKERFKNRRALVDTLLNLQTCLPAALADDMFVSTLPSDLVCALQTVLLYTPGLATMPGGLSSSDNERIDAALRDRQEDGYLGAKAMDVSNQFARVCFDAFGCCPADVLMLLTNGLVPTNSAVGIAKAEALVSSSLKLLESAEKLRLRLAATTATDTKAASMSRLWVFGKPKPIQRR